MSQSCYAIDGIQLPDYRPCDSGSGPRVCCTAGQICLSNGLCAVDIGAFYNGGCTDPTYKSAICPKFCINGSNHFIVQCKSGAVRQGDFCCSGDGNTDCCDEASNGLGLASRSSAARIAFVTSNPTISSPAAFTITVTASNSAFPSFQTTTLIEPNSLGGQPPWSSPLLPASTVTYTAYSALPATDHITEGKLHPKLSREKRIAIGISLGLGTPLFCILVILLRKYSLRYWARRHRKRTDRQHDRMAAALAEIDAAYVAPSGLRSRGPATATEEGEAVELPVVRSRANSAQHDGLGGSGGAPDTALLTGEQPLTDIRTSDEPPIRPDSTRDVHVAQWLADVSGDGDGAAATPEAGREGPGAPRTYAPIGGLTGSRRGDRDGNVPGGQMDTGTSVISRDWELDRDPGGGAEGKKKEVR